MGANQSSGADPATPGGGEVKTSYYELLGVERTATEEEIKKAYRRKALELHPDRNYGHVERTTKLFAEVQVAYEILSEPQERAWYDSHEGQILRGDNGGTEEHFEHNMRVTTADDITRMLRKFHGGIDFSDSPSGFFGFLRETFETLAREEEAAADWEGTDVIDYPSFGHRDDTYEDVVRPFYNVWNGFSTKKSFAWKDKYRYSDAEDRRMRRAMEKENKRMRDEAIREFNDAVRTLVAFVRKRDPRYTPNTQTDEERTKAQRAAAAKQAARSRAAHAAKVQEDAIPEWAMARDPDELEEEEEEDLEDEVYECVACHKTFKSEKQYDAHEKSKKHQKAIYTLRRRMQKENANLNLDDDFTSSGFDTPEVMNQDDGQELVDEEQEQVEGNMSTADIDAGIKDLKVTAENAEEDDDDDEDQHESTTKPQNQNQTSAKPITPSPTTPNDSDSSEEDDNDDDDDEYAPRSAIESRLTSTTAPKSLDLENSPPPTSNPLKLGKAAQKRAKKAAKHAEAEQAELQHRCVVCNAGFSSKTKMFQHIKDLGHVAPLAAVKGGGGGKKGKRR
jgi:DnaJ family protein A protein 5